MEFELTRIIFSLGGQILAWQLLTSWKRGCSEHGLTAARWSQPLCTDNLEGSPELTVKAEGKEPRE